jgi:hypothetical protein
VTDDWLRSLYVRVLDRRPSLGALGLSIERMLALVERRGSRSDRLRTLDAVMSRRDSIAELEILWAASGRQRTVARGRWWTLGVVGLAAAASVVLVIGTAVITENWPARPEQTRGGAGPIVELVTPAERVTGRPVTFSWKPVSDARDYEIEVLDADGLSAFVSTVRGTSVELPATVHLLPGTDYRWWVVARRADGSRVGAVPRRLRVGEGIDRRGAVVPQPNEPLRVVS